MHVYVFWRVWSIPVVWKRVPRPAVFGLAAFLGPSFLLSRLLRDLPWPSRLLELIGTNWIGILFLCFVCLLAIDLLTVFGLVLRNHVCRLRTWALITAVVLSAIAFVQAFRPPVVEEYEVRIANLPKDLDGSVVVALSDLHLGRTLGDKWLSARVQQVQELHPDLIVLCGDIVEGDDPAEAGLLVTLHQLKAPMGVWAAAGNHESHNDGQPNHVLESAGIRVLRNQWVQVRPELVLAGVEDLTQLRRVGDSRDVISNVLANRPPGTLILLSHSPLYTERAASSGAQLMLSGHTHNGQIWPFNYVVRRLYPYMNGLYRVGGMSLVVSRGTGTWGPRMRLWQRGEIAKIVLRGS